MAIIRIEIERDYDDFFCETLERAPVKEYSAIVRKEGPFGRKVLIGRGPTVDEAVDSVLAILGVPRMSVVDVVDAEEAA
jgi:hypothetical protein